MNNVIVTGANGFIGSKLICRLLQSRVTVFAIDQSFANTKLPNTVLLKKIEANLSNTEEIQAILPANDYDAFYHFAWAGVNGPSKADPFVQLKNIEMAINCSQLAKRLNVRKFLCAGTIAERSVESLDELESTSGGMMYGVAKHCARLFLEAYCKRIGIKLIWMQFSNIYGPDNNTGNIIGYTVDRILRGEKACFGPALQPYDFIYVDDLVDAIIKIGNADTKEDCYYIGSGEPRRLKDFLLEIGVLAHHKDSIIIGALPDDGIRYRSEMFDVSTLKREIGDYVTTSFSEGITQTINSFTKTFE